LPAEIPREVHEADASILYDEFTQNMSAPDQPWTHMPDRLGVKLQFWEPWRAEKEFLAAYRRLTGGPG